MSKGRVEAFSDGVLAIVITVMVLELRVPHSSKWIALKPLLPVFISYILSFTTIAIYWNNHHHLFQAVHKVNGKVLWSNIHLLFWLSLFPFVTAWMGENDFSRIPVILYGLVLFMAGVAYYFLEYVLTELHGKDSAFAQALGGDKKGKLSMIIYVFGVVLSFIQPLIGLVLYFIVAAMWFIPDKRFEKTPNEVKIQ